MNTVSDKQDIRNIDTKTLINFLLKIGEKPFKAKQINEWLWKKSVQTFDQMSNLSLETRKSLADNFSFKPVDLSGTQVSSDKTIKSIFKLHDGNLVEGVLIPSKSRITACISSQVGCSLSCKFCATGYMERKRNLDAAEIYDQVVHIRDQAEKEFKSPLTNIVYMGMGEPLLNYDNVLQSVEHITSENGLGMSAKRITVSTAGIAKMIKRLADDKVKFNLALSLHAASDAKRNQIMPINESNSLESLEEALDYYYKATRNRITFEYILFYDFNDSIKDAEDLHKFCKKIPSKVNVIEYNPIDNSNFKNADADALEKFRDYLEDRGVNVKVRRSRGKDIDAACGQLANKQ